MDIDKALDARARRAARSCGLRLCKSRRYRPPDDLGEYMLLNPEYNSSVLGFKYDASAEEVLEYCR